VNRAKKVERVEKLSEVFNTSSAIVVAHNKGLNVLAFHDLRKRMKKSDGQCMVVKNRLTSFAIQSSEYGNSLSDIFRGPTVILYSKGDPSPMIKALVDFCKGNEMLQIMGAAMTKDKLSMADVKTLAELPSLKELRAEVLGLLISPMTAFARVLAASPQKIVGVLSAYAEK